MTSHSPPKRSFSEAGLDQEHEAFLEQNHKIPQSPIPTSVGDKDDVLRAEKSIEHLMHQQLEPPRPLHSAPVESPQSPSITTITAGSKAAKRVKLDLKQQEAKKIEKEQKERQRAEEKARKEAEKAQKELQKTQKAQEKQERDEQKKEEQRKAQEERERIKEEKKQKAEEERQKKETDRAKKDEEKQKKEKSQLRLNAFFTTPGVSTGSTNGSPTPDRSPLGSRRSSVAEVNSHGMDHFDSRFVSVSPSKLKGSDYQRLFPDFFIQSHTMLAPINRFLVKEKNLLDFQLTVDRPTMLTETQDQGSGSELTAFLATLKGKSRHGRKNCSLRELVEKLNGSPRNPIDLTDRENSTPPDNPLALLKAIPLKSIRFAEDVRPPYVGTYTKRPLRGSLQSLAKKPFEQVRPDTKYDYDSEAEWEDPGEGEDLLSEGEEEIDEDEDDPDMEGFLDDEDAQNAARPLKRKPLLGELEPSCSGICWEGEGLTASGEARPDLSIYNIDVLLENPSLPIDPYSSAYWQPPILTKQVAQKSAGPRNNIITSMDPPRMPLQPVSHRGNTLLPFSSISTTSEGHSGLGKITLLDPQVSSYHPQSKIATTIATTAGKTTASKSSKRYIAPELINEFKQAVQGSDMTKMGLIEMLKKQFPKQPKDAIKDTLEEVAERVGTKNAEKKWVLKVFEGESK